MHYLNNLYYALLFYRHFFFFFQAEDGIRDKLVTGVQTCALPISPSRLRFAEDEELEVAALRKREADGMVRRLAPLLEQGQVGARLVRCLSHRAQEILGGDSRRATRRGQDAA